MVQTADKPCPYGAYLLEAGQRHRHIITSVVNKINGAIGYRARGGKLFLKGQVVNALGLQVI